MSLEGTEYQLEEKQGLRAAKGKHTVHMSLHQLPCARRSCVPVSERQESV